MSTQRTDRGGNQALHDAFTGAERELTINTDTDEPHIHDGARVGGFPVPNFSSQQKRLYSYDGSPTGTATAIAASTQVDAVALTAGLELTVKMGSTATGASTLQWGSLAVKDIKKYSGGVKAAIEADDWVISQEISFWYDGTDWVAQLGGGGGASAIITTEITSPVSSVDFAGIFQDGFAYEVYYSDVTPSSDGAIFQARLSSDAGVTWLATNYMYVLNHSRTANAVLLDGDANHTSIRLNNNVGSATDESCAGDITLYDPANASTVPYLKQRSVAIRNDDRLNSCEGTGSYNTTGVAMDSLRLFFSAGNVETGKFSIYEKALS